MRYLIRQQFSTGADGVEYRDTELNVDPLTIGRNERQAIALKGKQIAPAHVEIRPARDGQLQVKTLSGTEPIKYNNADVTACYLDLNEAFEIGSYKITSLAAPMGFDAALMLDVLDSDEDEAINEDLYVASLAKAGFKKRRWSWLLVVLILFTTLLWPAYSLINESVRQKLRDSAWLPSDGLWLTGPLIRAHQIPEIGNNCTKCHVKPFQMTPSAACLDCHKMTTVHVDIDKLAVDEKKLSQLNQWRCSLCHKEHNEPAIIVRQDQQLCTDCHEEKTALPKRLAQNTLSDYDQHPEFRYTLLRMIDSGGQWTADRMSLQEAASNSGMRNISNLKYNHKVHLDKEGVDSPNGRQFLKCNDCHVLDADKDSLLPITMEQHCSECHLLNFDDENNNRLLPHGKPEQILGMLQEFYSKQALTGRKNTAGPKRRRIIRRPGKQTSSPRIGKSFAWAKRQAQQTAQIVFEKSVCNDCHTVSRRSDNEWTVLPVRLNQDWLPKSYFSHKDHLTEKCILCHDAKSSELAREVLMPEIKTCNKCHGGIINKQRLESDCYMCHRFHIPKNQSLAKSFKR